MKGIIYVNEIAEEYRGKRLEHMIGEELLRMGLKREYGKDLRFEPRETGEHGKPFFTLEPGIRYNISHSGNYVMCIFSGQEVGIDVQEHRKVNMPLMLERMVPPEMIPEILHGVNPERAFFIQWVLREAYIKWTGQGLSRDLRTIPMEEGWHTLLDLPEGYSGAVWSQSPMDLVMEKVEITLE